MPHSQEKLTVFLRTPVFSVSFLNYAGGLLCKNYINKCELKQIQAGFHGIERYVVQPVLAAVVGHGESQPMQ